MSSTKNFKQKLLDYLLQSLITLAILILGLFAYGKAFGPISLSINQKNPQRTFQVIGNGRVEVKPDIIQTVFSIQEEGLNQKEAAEKGNEKNNKTIKALIDLGIKQDDIKTISYSINPDYDLKDGRKITGYTIYINTQVKASDLNKINSAIDKLTEIGINTNGINYSINNQEKYKEEARNLAIKNAKQKAENLSKAAGFSLGEIASIKELEEPNLIRPLFAAQPKALALNDQKTNIQEGVNEITAQVQIEYYIK